MSKYKLKYYSLSREEKENLKKDFYNTSNGKEVNIRLKRVLLYGIFGILFSIYLFFSENILAFKFIAALLFIVSIIFIISSYKVRINKLNEFLTKK